MASNGSKPEFREEISENVGPNCPNYLDQIKTSSGMTITPEMFEMVLFLSHQLNIYDL
jgi:hypothetical protein